jgi:hypothetical protein
VEVYEAAGAEIRVEGDLVVVGPIALCGQVAEHVGDPCSRESVELEGAGRMWASGHRRVRAYADGPPDDRAVVPRV